MIENSLDFEGLSYYTEKVKEYVDDKVSIAVPDGVTYINSEGSEEVGDILPVDADTLEGHGADYFAKSEDLEGYLPKSGGGEITSSSREILTVTRTVGSPSIAFKGNGSALGEIGFDGANKPVFWDTSGSIKTLLHSGNFTDYALAKNGKAADSDKLDGNDSSYFAKASDLANYLPLTGGTVNGNVTVKADDTSQRIHTLQNSARRVYQTIGTGGNYNLYDGTNGKAIIVSTVDGANTFNGTANGNLPLTGGKLSKNTVDVLTLANTASNYNYLLFEGASGSLGGIGFAEVGNLVHVNSALNQTNTLLHTGNYTSYITPANIGAAPSSHNQGASTITDGTLAGRVQANATAAATLTNPQVRDIVIKASVTEGGTASEPNGTIVFSKS